MIDINKMSIRELDEYLGLQLEYEDIQYIIEKDNILTEISELGKCYEKKGIVPVDKIVEFLIENEKHVNKERLLLVNYYAHVYIEELEKEYRIAEIKEKLKIKTGKELQEGKEKAKEAVEVLRGKDVKFVEFEEYGSLRLLSSKEILGEPLSLEEKKKERTTKKTMKKLPKEAIVFMFMLTNSSKVNVDKDIYDIPFLGKRLLGAAAEKSFMRKGMSTQEINRLDKNKEFCSYLLQHLDDFDGEEIQKVSAGIEKYMDMRKLCLLTFAKLVDDMERGEIIYYKDGDHMEMMLDTKSYYRAFYPNYAYFGEYLPEYFSIISEEDTQVKFGDIVYTTQDAKEAMKKYINGVYMSDICMETQIIQLLKGKMEISNMNPRHLQYLKTYLIDRRNVKSTDELKNMIDIGLLREQDILKMYKNEKIGIEDIHQTKDGLNLEKFITPHFILQEMDKLDLAQEENQGKNQEENETIERYIELYKELYLNGKSEEEIEKAGETFIEELHANQKDEGTVEKQEQLLNYGVLSSETYAILASKGIVKTDDFMQMYQNNCINLDMIKQLQEKGISFDRIDVEPYLIESFMRTREQENPDNTELNKYASLYKTIKLKGLSERGKQKTADEFLMEIGERIENDIEAGKQKKDFEAQDRKRLYELGVIPIDIIIPWADKKEIIELLKSDGLVPRDVRKLYREGDITIQDIEDIIASRENDFSANIHLINIIFSNASDSEVRKELLKKVKGLSTTIKSSKNTDEKSKDKEKNIHGNDDGEVEPGEGEFRYLFDTAVRYNAWIESDKDAKLTKLKDGHVLIELPNHKGGLVILEQLYRWKRNKETHKMELIDNYGARGYVLTEGEYEANQSRFITKDNRVKRSELIDIMQKELPNLEEKGILRELTHSKNQYPEKVQKLLGVPDYLARARGEEKRDKALQRVVDSQEYTEEEKEKIMQINEAWESVRNSREYYEEI